MHSTNLYVPRRSPSASFSGIDDEGPEDLDDSYKERVEGIDRTEDGKRKRSDSGVNILDAIATAQRVTQIIDGVNSSCSQEIRGELNRAVVILQTAAEKQHQGSKTVNMELKKAISNVFGEIKKVNKRLEIVDHNSKEAMRIASSSNLLLEEISLKLDRGHPNIPVKLTYPLDEAPKSIERNKTLRLYCTYCEAVTHDTTGCRRKEQCFRCGDDDHKQSLCYWKERSCRICQIRGHKMEMHDAKDVKLRGILVAQFPGKFLHFLLEGQPSAAPAARQASSSTRPGPSGGDWAMGRSRY